MSTPQPSPNSFTPQQLQDAFAQMSFERERERLHASLAAETLGKLLGTGVRAEDPRSRWSNSFGHVSPAPVRYDIAVTYETYGPYKPDLLAALARIPGVTLASNAATCHDYEIAFEWDVSGHPHLGRGDQKIFKGRFEYFDNHWSGY